MEDIWGISRRWGSKLRMIGIGNALDLRDASANKIRQYLGVVVQRIVYELRGISCLDLDKILHKKNIMCYVLFCVCTHILYVRLYMGIYIYIYYEPSLNLLQSTMYVWYVVACACFTFYV